MAKQIRTETKYMGLGLLVLVILGLILTQISGDAASTAIALNKLKIATGFTLLTLIFLFGLRLLLGLAEAPAFPANSRIVAAWFPAAERGTAAAISPC